MNAPSGEARQTRDGPQIQGLHHVTATVDRAEADVDFYVRFLGMRLVKKTVNFDNPHVYHLYYGNGSGTPGTLMTTFPYGGRGVPSGSHGNGQIAATRFSIPMGSADFWADRAQAAAMDADAQTSAFREAFVHVMDPSGLQIELVETDDPRPAWPGESVPSGHRITGLHSVCFPVSDVSMSVEFLSGFLGWEIVDEGATALGVAMTRMAVNEGGASRWIDIADGSGGSRGSNGLGTVHHVAMAVSDDATQQAFLKRIVEAGVPVTDVKDRQYFRSIYFREPGGVLYEIATLPPGFSIDEEESQLGTTLKLPPWEEANRPHIEAGLDPIG